jgi:hypothetical protein
LPPRSAGNKEEFGKEYQCYQKYHLHGLMEIYPCKAVYRFIQDEVRFMRSARRAEAIAYIDGLENQLARVRAAQRKMRSANAAVRDGDVQLLAGLGFSPGHIRRLRRLHRDGLTPFPASAFQSNAELKRRLERELVLCWGRLIARSVEGRVMLLLDAGRPLAGSAWS